MTMRRVLAALLATMLALGCFSACAEGLEIKSLVDSVTKTVEVNPAAPLASELNGLYSVDLTMDNGTVRKVYHYVPSTLGYRQPAVAVAMPSGSEPAAFLASSGWQAVADENGMSVILMAAGEAGWQADEAEYTYAAFGYMDDRTYLQMQDSAFYMVGYGDGANSVMAHAVTNSELFSGFAAFGVDNFDVSILEAAKATPSNAAGVMKSEVSVPVWFGAETKTASVEALIAYWTNANNCGDEALSSKYASEIYAPVDYLSRTNEITYDDCSKVLVSVDGQDVLSPDFTSYLYNKFLKRTRRQDSGDINALRPFATNEELGMEYKTIEVEGTTREFYVYLPDEVKSGEMTNVPLVFAFHGGGGSGEEFAGRSGWHKLAEERDFIAVFPTGSRSNNKFKASSTWQISDIAFFEALRAYMIDNYTVDASRIYVSGQSMGCMMSSWIALIRPELIAACAATSARCVPDEVENVNKNLVMPYMWSVGEKDKYFVEGGKDYGMVPATIEQWRVRYGITETEETTYAYQNGDFWGYDFKNEQGITLVREQWVNDKIHAMLPDEVYTLYDFMSCYSRGEDGTSYYMGIAIEE